MPFSRANIYHVSQASFATDTARMTSLSDDSFPFHDRALNNPAETAMDPRVFSTRLPGELRNRIYRYALVSDAPIQLVGDTLKQPALLQVSRQLRQEAAAIYYSENKFNLDIYDMAGIIMIPFRKVLVKYRTKSIKGNFIFKTHGAKDWVNLLAWLKANHENSRLACAKTFIEEGSTASRKVVAQAFRIVDTLRQRPWEAVAEVLEAYHQGIAALDKAWT